MIERCARLATQRTRRILLIAGAVFLLAAALGVPVVSILKSESSDFQDPQAQNQQVAARDRTCHRPVGRLRRRGARAQRRRCAQRPGRGSAGARTWSRCSPAARLSARARLSRATHLPVLVSRDGHETLVLAAFATANGRRRRSNTCARGSPAAACASGGNDVAFNEINKRTSSDLARAEMFALPDPAAALVLGVPRPDRGRPAAARGGLRDRDHLPAAAPDRPVRRPVDLRRQPRHRHRTRARASTTACSCSRATARSSPRGLDTSRGDPPHAADRGTHRAVTAR